MGKKKGKPQQHRMSFEELVSGRTLEYMKPYIGEVCEQLSNYHARRITMQLLSDLSDVVHHQAVMQDLVKEKFGISDEEYRDRIADKEDGSMGLTKSSNPAEKGDYLRISIQGRDEKNTEFGTASRWKIPKLAEPRQENQYTISQEVEEAILGMNAGETKEIPQEVKTKVKNEAGELEDKVYKYFWKVTVDRISSRPKPPEKPKDDETSTEKEEAANG